MIYTDFQNKKLSMLGFGAMRLPTKSDGSIDEKELADMIDYAILHGINYFDTAYSYHGGMSEIALGKVLSKYPREAFFLATKYPGHQISENYNPAEVFENQLKKCRVEYFDFYLLHNVCESSVGIYLDKKLEIIEYFKEQKRLGRIKHLGFSCHARIDTMKDFLNAAGEDMEFCQIQLNWMDWTLQNAKEKVELLNERNIPIWVMEPVRGGKLCKLADIAEDTLHSYRPNESIPAWGFRFLQGIKGVTMILSGMSDMAQIKDNIHTFEEFKPLSYKENEVILGIAEGIKSSVPCTACRYCTAGCPAGLDIPMLIETYNELVFVPTVNSSMRVELLPQEKQPTACIACGKCKQICPQGIDIPATMQALSEKLKEIPKWREISRIREEEAKILNKN